jgi:hypothetical protein
MAARRHLPVLQTPPKTPVAESPATQQDPPPWHWIPLGTVVSVVTFALLAQGAGALAARVLARVYPAHATASQIADIHRLRPTASYGAELLAGTLSASALLAAIALGGYFIGRYGTHTNQRHGTLSGACTALLFWAVTGWLPSMLVMVAPAMLAGWGAALFGCRVRDRDIAQSAP